MEIVQASIAVDKLPFTHRAASVAKGSKPTFVAPQPRNEQVYAKRI